MAQVPYSGGVPTTLPETRPPPDYQQIPTRLQDFGAAVGAGEEKLGEGALGAARFYGQVVASDASNKLMEGTTRILSGDPSQTTIGPDGRPVPDLGYLATRGADALSRRQSAEQQLEELRTQLRENLPSAKSQLEFDDFSRRFLAYKSGEIGAHADQQANVWYGRVEKSQADNAIAGIRQNPGDRGQVDRNTQLIIQARVRAAQRLIGDTQNPEATGVLQDAVNSGKADALEARIDALYPTDPTRAQQLLQSPDAALLKGPRYDALSAKLQQQGDASDAQRLVFGSTPGAAIDASQPLADVISGGGIGPLIDHIVHNEGGSPRGVENNPGNIKFTGLPGQVNSGVQAKDGGAFASYQSPDARRAAIAGLTTNAAQGRSSAYGAAPTVGGFLRTYTGGGSPNIAAQLTQDPAVAQVVAEPPAPARSTRRA